MPGSGSSHITGEESIIFADNASFDGTKRGGALAEDLEVWIGDDDPPHVRKKKLVEGTGISIDNSDPEEVVFNSTVDGGVQSVSGTMDRITISGTAEDPIVDIASTYIGQATITTLGTVTTGTWNATAITETFGGTGQISYATGDILYASDTNELSKLSAGTNGHVLTLDSGIPSWQPIPAASVSITFIDDTDSPYEVLAADQYLSCDVSSGTLTIELPNSPTTGRVIRIKDAEGNAATNNISVTTVGGTVEIDGETTYLMNTNYQSISLIFNGSAYEVF